MSIVGSVMDLFRPGAQPQQATQAQPTNGQPTTPAEPSMQQQPVADDPTAAVDPMDSFKELWAPVEKKEGQEEEFNPGALFNLDPASIQKSVSAINFADMITAEQLTAIQGGGEEAVKAFAAALNGTASKVMTLSTTASAKMIESAMSRASGAMDKKIDSQTKAHQVSSQLQELNPALNSAAAAPITAMIKSQILQKYPTATAAEVTQLTNQYLTAFAETAAGKKPASEPASIPGETDWGTFLTPTNN